MNAWTFVHPERIHLVWVAIAIVVGLAVLELRTRDALTTFLSPVMQRRLTAQATTARIFTRLALILLALLCAVGALMRPQAMDERETVTTSAVGADVMFVLDVSRSMLATDVAPNRLARAKAEVGQLVGQLEEHRVGLVVFAGRAVQACPLTPDHAFFSTVLASVDTRSAAKGGTKVGDAIKTALRGFPTGDGAKVIVLISDGDDQDPYSEEAAKAARDAGVKIITVGLGSEEGTEIRIVNPQSGAKETVMHEGKPVISKLNGEQLRKVALVTEGAYIPVGTSAIDLEAIMESHVKPMVNAARAATLRKIPAERFQWLVLASLVSLLLALWVGAGAGERRAR